MSERSLDELSGSSAVPRRNGELVFEEPWESRAFGIAVALEAQGTYEWRSFRDELVAQIAEAEAAGDESTYYERWLKALERLLLQKGLVDPADLEAKVDEYASGLHDEDGHIH